MLAMIELPELTIGEVARRAGVATSSIRYYERIGLLPAPERVSGQRRYETDVLGKLGFIGVAQSAGFKLSEIRELIEGVDSTDGMAGADAQALGPQARRGEALLERTRAMKGWLEVAKECGCATPEGSARSSRRRTGSSTDADVALRLVKVEGKDCRRPPAGGRASEARARCDCHGRNRH